VAGRSTRSLAITKEVIVNIWQPRVVGALCVGFTLGLSFAGLSGAFASTNEAASDVTHKIFALSVDEVKKSFVFGEEFAGAYKGTFTLSDGSVRTIELTPMVHNGMQVVELKDTGHISYMGLNGTTTNGNLMIQLRDMAEMHRQLKEQGWKLPGQ
jgi:hypothetical protein